MYTFIQAARGRWQAGIKTEIQFALLRHLWTRLQRCRASGELSGSAEFTEDRAVVERRLEQAAEEVLYAARG